MNLKKIVCSMVSLAALLAARTSAAETEPLTPSEPPGGDLMARQHIPHMQGCYSVSYQFSSDGAHDFFVAGVVEYIDLKAKDAGYVLRHFMILDKMAFHHFTEEWTPLGDARWLQRVKSGTTGALRYEATGSWRFNQWEGSAVGATKPVRDTKQDYTTLDRRSSVQISTARWIHAENNTKRLEDGTPIATEVGWVQYERIDDALCAPGIELSGKLR